MKLTGHKTGSVHRGYAHHELEKLRAAEEKIPSLRRIQFATHGGSVRTLTPEKGGEWFTFTGTQQNFRLKSNPAALVFRLHET